MKTSWRSLDFIYEEQNLAGAVFQLIAAEDIYTPDHQKDENGKRTLEMINGVPASAGAVVATLTTDENDNLDVMGIRRAYDMHKDYVQEILKKAQIYGKGHRENLMRDFPELFSSEEELIQAIFSNYICEEDMLKRPLSKITMDLLKEL